MRRLQPLPERSSGSIHKKTVLGMESQPGEIGPSKATPPLVETASMSLKDDLTRMKSEIAVLEKEELVSHQSQLQVAQERLRTKRRSDLAKRMQESQRLQVLRERKVELEETRRSKLVDFKQKMIAAAERALEHESLVYDVLYDNIGQALAADVGDGFSDGNESVVIDDDVSAGMGVDAYGNKGCVAISPAARGPESFPDFSAQQFRVPSVFEEHLKAEQHQLTSQLRALRQVHSVPKMTGAGQAHHQKKDTGAVLLPPLAQSTTVHGAASTLLHKNNSVSPTLLPYLSGLPLSISGNESGGSQPAAPSSMPHESNAARIEHALVREELKRLIAQGSSEEQDQDSLALVSEVAHREDGKQSMAGAVAGHTISVLMTPHDLDSVVQERLAALEEKEAAAAKRDFVIQTAAVPFEDVLHKGNTIILEDAESNFKARFAVDKAERERLERLERLQGRSASLFGSTPVNEGDGAAPAKARSKTRRVSMLLDGESNSEPQKDTPALLETIPSVVSEPTSSAASPLSEESARRKERRRSSQEPLSAALAIVSNEVERQQLVFEQQQARFMARRTVQKEELSLMKRKLLELIQQDSLENEERERKASEAAQQEKPVEEAPTAAVADTPDQLPKGGSEGENPTPGTGTTPEVASLGTNMSATEQEQDAAALIIQCCVRCMLARRAAAAQRADYAATAERIARFVLEEEHQMKLERQAILKELARERDHLQSIAERERIFVESEALRNLQLKEEALVQEHELAVERARQCNAAVDIQRMVRGSQTRSWYRAVLVAREALTSAALARSASVIQMWWRRAAALKDACRRRAVRQRLADRYHQASHSNNFIAHAAASSIQRLALRFLTCKACSGRRAVAEQEARSHLWNDAAIVIERQWRKYWLHRQGTRRMVDDAVSTATRTASVLRCVPEGRGVQGAADAALVISKHVRGFIARDEWRKRWLRRLLQTACQTADSIRQEQHMMEDGVALTVDAA